MKIAIEMNLRVLILYCCRYRIVIKYRLLMSLLLLYSEAVGSYAENQRITAVRKVFQRGVQNPMINIELLWKDYCNFENVSTLAGMLLVWDIVGTHLHFMFCK